MRRIVSSLLLAVSLVPAAFAADSYSLDAAHTTIGFGVKHFAVSTTKGRFADFSGQIAFDGKDPAKSSVKVVIKVAGIDTGNAQRDAHLRNADFFDAEKFPEITFASASVVKTGETYEATGPLTIKGVSKTVTIPFALSGPVQDTWGNTRLGAEGSLVINRKDFGVSNAMDAPIGDQVKIELSIEAIKDQPKDGKNKKK